jgi:hypothetical protein
MTHSTDPEAQARLEIDRQLEAADWTIQSRAEMNLFAARGGPRVSAENLSNYGRQCTS